MANALTVEEIHELNFGLIGGWKRLQTVYENKMGTLGWPSGEKRRAALTLYYSRGGTNAILRSDKSYLRSLVCYTHFVLKKAERDQWPATDQTLTFLKIAYDAGYAPAVQHASRFCKQTNTPKPPWVLHWQDEIVDDAARFAPREKKKGGRHKGPSPQKWMADLFIFVSINFLRSQVGGTDRAGMPRWVTFDTALRVVRAIRFRNRHYANNEHHHLSTLVKAYDRTRTRFLALRD